jgi:hypothetical protein
VREWFKKSILSGIVRIWRHWLTRTILLLALGLPTCIVLILAIILPATYDPFGELPNPPVAVDKTAESGAEPISPELLEKINLLQLDEAYWQARSNLAKNRTIQLSIDLRDSVVALDINGVTVHQSKIHRCNISRVLTQIRPHGRLLPWLKDGFVLQKELATLPKAPIRIKEAPKDTIEANAASNNEIVIENRDVHFTWHFDRQLTVLVEQVQPPSFKGWLRKMKYTFQRNFGMASETVRTLAQLKIPRHRLVIELELPGDDAKAIYRALPEKAGLALRL